MWFDGMRAETVRYSSRAKPLQPQSGVTVVRLVYIETVKKLLAGICCATLLVGCGGGGLLAGILGNKFVGAYLGSLIGNAILYDLNFQVVSKGALSGILHDRGANLDANLTGTIDDAGNLSATALIGSKTVHLAGPVTLTNGHLQGQVNEIIDGNTAGGPVLTLDAVVQSAN